MLEFFTFIKQLSEEQLLRLSIIGFFILSPYCFLWVTFTGITKYTTTNKFCTNSGKLLIDIVLFGNAAFIIFGGLQLFVKGKIIQIFALMAPLLYVLFCWGLFGWAIQAFYRENFECIDYITIWRAWIVINGASVSMALFYSIFKALLCCCKSCSCLWEVLGEVVTSCCPRMRKYLILQQKAQAKSDIKKTPEGIPTAKSAVVWSVKSKDNIPVLSDYEMKKIMQHL